MFIAMYIALISINSGYLFAILVHYYKSKKIHEELDAAQAELAKYRNIPETRMVPNGQYIIDRAMTHIYDAKNKL